MYLLLRQLRIAKVKERLPYSCDSTYHLGDPLHAVAHACKDDGEGEDGKEDKADLRRSAAGNEGREVAVCGQPTPLAADVVGRDTG